MADYFTRFSVIFALPNADARAWALQLAKQGGDSFGGDTLSEDFPKELVPAVEDWTFETEAQQGTKSEIWLHGDNGGIDGACLFLQHLLKKFNPDGYVAFQWSDDCSAPRVDAYGGGAAIVTAKKIKTMNTRQWLQKHLPKQKT